MNAIPEQYHESSKEFRAYMRVQRGERGTFLSNLMDGAEAHLSRIVMANIDHDFTILYDRSISIEQLVRYYLTMELNDEWMTVENGHTAWKSLRYYLDFRANKDGIDWKHIYESLKREFEKAGEKIKKRTERELRTKKEFTEGNLVESHYDRRERDHGARSKCIEHYGCKCAICGFDFRAQYGEIGEGFIEVHHVVPISSTAGEQDVDPINGLIPVCSNCHSILHRRRPTPFHPEDVRKMLEGNK